MLTAQKWFPSTLLSGVEMGALCPNCLHLQKTIPILLHLKMKIVRVYGELTDLKRYFKTLLIVIMDKSTTIQ